MKISQNAINSVAAAISNKSRARTPEEVEFDNCVSNVIHKSTGHRQRRIKLHKANKPAFNKALFKMAGRRLYTVTTIAASARYGGIRTPVVCDSFKAAKRIVELNGVGIYETTYQLAVIESIIPNWLYYSLGEQYWYVWKGSCETGKYVPIEAPERYINSSGLSGIG